MFPHALGLSFYVEAVFDVAQEHQLQVVADVVVYSHVIADHVDAQGAITFADGLLFVSSVSRGEFGDHIMGEKAAETCHDLGVKSIYVIGRDEFFRLRHLEHFHHVQG